MLCSVGSWQSEFKVITFCSARYCHLMSFDKKLACLTNYQERQSFPWPLVYLYSAHRITPALDASVHVILGSPVNSARSQRPAGYSLPLYFLVHGRSRKICTYSILVEGKTVQIGFCDYGLSDQSGFSDRKPLDGPLLVQK